MSARKRIEEFIHFQLGELMGSEKGNLPLQNAESRRLEAEFGRTSIGSRMS